MAIDYSNLAYGQQYFPEEVDETVTETVYPNEPFLYSDLNPYRSETEKFRKRFDPTQIEAAAEKKGFSFPSIIGTVKGGMEWLGDKFGMTQVTDADRTANQQFMQDQGIYRHPTTGRMIGGDFAGKNAPGTSAWGSANFGEMAQAWDEKYGDMQYRTQKMIAKQKRIKDQAAAYAQKLEADKIAAAATKTGSGHDPNVHGPQDYGRGSDGQQSYDFGQGFGWSATGSGPVSNRTGRGRTDWAQGGRIGLRMGGDPTQWMSEEETITPFQLQKEEGVDMGLQASDDVNTRILENLFEKYLDLGFSPGEAEKLAMEEFESMAQGSGQGEGIASLV